MKIGKLLGTLNPPTAYSTSKPDKRYRTGVRRTRSQRRASKQHRSR